MVNAIILTDPLLSTADACRVAGLSEVDLENWNRIESPFGILVTDGRRPRRMYSVLDVVRLKLMLALCGPTSPGSRSRTFLSPTIARGTVGLMLDQCIVPDAFGYIKEPGPVASQRFLVVRCAGDDDHLTADVLHGGEVMEALGNIDHQLLAIPVTKLVHKTIVACAEIMTQSKHPKQVARLAQAVAEATTGGGR